jgi:type 1 glutamine amidotransferase
VGGGSRGHDAIHEFDVNVVKEHPVTLGLPKSFKATDELYHVNVDTNGNSIEVLAQTSVANNTRREHPSIWLVNHPKARVVAIALGHDGRVHDLPDYKRLLVNAVNWAARKSN